MGSKFVNIKIVIGNRGREGVTIDRQREKYNVTI